MPWTRSAINLDINAKSQNGDFVKLWQFIALVDCDLPGTGLVSLIGDVGRFVWGQDDTSTYR